VQHRIVGHSFNPESISLQLQLQLWPFNSINLAQACNCIVGHSFNQSHSGLHLWPFNSINPAAAATTTASWVIHWQSRSIVSLTIQSTNLAATASWAIHSINPAVTASSVIHSISLTIQSINLACNGVGYSIALPGRCIVGCHAIALPGRCILGTRFFRLPPPQEQNKIQIHFEWHRVRTPV